MQKNIECSFTSKIINDAAFFFREELNHWLNLVIFWWCEGRILTQTRETILDSGTVYSIESSRFLCRNIMAISRLFLISASKIICRLLRIPPMTLWRNTRLSERRQHGRVSFYSWECSDWLWAVVSLIRNHCVIEIVIDEILTRLRIRRIEDFTSANSEGATLRINPAGIKIVRPTSLQTELRNVPNQAPSKLTHLSSEPKDQFLFRDQLHPVCFWYWFSLS